MSDPRYNDIACNLRRTAKRLEEEARAHRRLADQIDHIFTTRAPANPLPPHIKSLNAAADELLHMPAAELRKAAPSVARRTGNDVFAVASLAQRKRADLKARAKRQLGLDIMARIKRGETLKATALQLGVSVATARRVRDAWVKG